MNIATPAQVQQIRDLIPHCHVADDFERVMCARIRNAGYSGVKGFEDMPNFEVERIIKHLQGRVRGSDE